MKKSFLLAVLFATVVLLSGNPTLQARIGNECQESPETFCHMQCSWLGTEDDGYLACFDPAQGRCCWEGPNSCGDSQSCSECSGCNEELAF